MEIIAVPTTTNFLHISGVFVAQLIRYARVCLKYENFLLRGSILHRNLRLLFGNSMVIIQTLHTNLKSMSHILKGFFIYHDICHVSRSLKS